MKRELGYFKRIIALVLVAVIVIMPNLYVKADGEEGEPIEVNNELDPLGAPTVSHDIAVTATANGIVTYGAESGSVSNTTVRVEEGATATFQIIPNSGYYLSGITIDSVAKSIGEITGNTGNNNYSIAFSGVAGTHSISAVFSSIETVMGRDADISIVFDIPTDANSLKIEENTKTYFLSKNSGVVISITGKQILDTVDGVYKDSIRIENTRSFSQLVVRSTSGSFSDSIQNYQLTNGLAFIADTTAPDLELTNSGQGWFSGKETELSITGTVSDTESGVNKVVWFTTQKNIVNDAAEILSADMNKATIENSTFSIVLQGAALPSVETAYYIYAVDNMGNISEVTELMSKDTTEPAVNLTSIEVYKKNGFLFIKKRAVDITAVGTDTQSGIKNITIFLNGTKVETKGVGQDNSAKFTIDLGYMKKDINITAIAEDNVGNITTVPIGFGGTADFDGDAPTVVAIAQGDKPYVNGTAIYSNENVELKIDAGDATSGIKDVTVKINSQLISQDKDGVDIASYYTKNNEIVKTASFYIGTSQVTTSDTYQVEIAVTDNTDTKVTKQIVIYMDTAKPRIGTIGVSGNEVAATDIPKDTYELFGSETIELLVTADDGVTGSGLKSIEYYLENDNGQMSNVQNAVANAEGIANVTVPADFKGHIYARATDNVGNASETYMTTCGIIAESETKHVATSNILLTADATSKKDAAGNNLYSSDTNVTISVSDTYSGIKSIEWSVQAPNDNTNDVDGNVIVDAEGNTSDNTWTVDATEKNLVTQMSNRIPIIGNSNQISIQVKLTDNAGNVSEKELKVSIDKSSPIVEISFDNNTSDGTYKEYYNANRVAKITVKERNFSPNDIVLAITNSGGNIPTISNWTTAENSANPDANVHTATVTFSGDGDYTFSANYTDMAGNSGNAFSAPKFTIDKKAPEISVTYQKQATAGNYYNSQVTATIIVKEHNFTPERIKVNGSVTNEGVNSSFPVVGAWITNGDVHTASVTFSQDGEYLFTVEGIDKAGNTANQYQSERYVVDMTAPVIEISGVEDMSANNGVVKPVIRFADTNFDSSSQTITLEGANNGLMEPTGQYSEIKNGRTFTFSDFVMEQGVDDIYTLTATETDLAGNRSEKSIMFSVNRFGSVYVFDDSLKEIDGKYVKEPIDVKLTETNVDSLNKETMKVVLSQNGIPKTLMMDVDYKVIQKGGDGSWCQYEYTIDKELFESDGTYTVALYSEDAAGNVNENIDETKKAEITFGVDTTAPVIIPVNLEENGSYNTENYQASVFINDNLVLSEVIVEVDGKQTECTKDGEDYVFHIQEAGTKQTVTISAVDAAGNMVDYKISNLLISTNIFVRWFNNTALFISSLAGAGVVIAGVGFIIRFKRKGIVRIKKH